MLEFRVRHAARWEHGHRDALFSEVARTACRWIWAASQLLSRFEFDLLNRLGFEFHRLNSTRCSMVFSKTSMKEPRMKATTMLRHITTPNTYHAMKNTFTPPPKAAEKPSTNTNQLFTTSSSNNKTIP